MSILPDFPDWLPIQQKIGDLLVQEVNVNHNGNVSYGPFYVANWDAMALVAFWGLSLGQWSITFHYFLDAGLLLETARFTYMTNGTIISDCHPVCGNYCTVNFQRSNPADTMNAFWGCYTRQGNVPHSRYQEDSMVCNLLTAGVGAGLQQTITPTRLLPGPCTASLDSTQPGARLEVQYSNFGGTFRTIAGLEIVAPAQVGSINFEAPPGYIRMVNTNTAAVAADLHGSIVARWPA